MLRVKTIKQLALQSLCLSCVLFMTQGCASSRTDKGPIDTTNFTELAKLNNKKVAGKKNAANNIRVTALKNTALTLGAQAGLAWKSEELNKGVLTKAIALRNTYNFGALILPHGVLPPVLTKGSNTLNLNDPTTLRMTDRTYKIVANARFVTTPPTWRNYLIMHFSKPDVPSKVLLPKTKAEQLIWQKYLRIGWKNGVKQAGNIYAENLARLNRDYHGMLLYQQLLAQKMVSAPYVAKTDLGITGDQNQMNIGDKVLRISALSGLKKQSNDWRAYIVENP